MAKNNENKGPGLIGRFLNKKNKPTKRVVFGTFEYSDDIEYLKHLSTMSPEQAVLSLVAASAFAQSKGIYSFEESEVIITAIRKLTLFENKDEKIKT